MKNIKELYMLGLGSIVLVIGIILMAYEFSPILYLGTFTLSLLITIAAVLITAKKESTAS